MTSSGWHPPRSHRLLHRRPEVESPRRAAARGVVVGVVRGNRGESPGSKSLSRKFSEPD